MARLDNQRHEKFCRLFVLGHPKFDPTTPPSEGVPDTRNNATQSYIHAGFEPRTNGAARSGGCRLTNRSDIRSRINELRDEQQSIEQIRLRRWKALLPDAQDVLLRAMRGDEDVNAVQLRAAQEVIEQAVGPTRFRFGVQKGADRDGGLNIMIYGSRGGPEEED